MGTLTMLAELKSFAGKRVLVTGHTGFKGSWLVSILREVGADVMGLALSPEPGQHFDLLGLAGKMRHVIGDVRDAAAVDRAVLGFQPEYVFHLAAQALVRRSYEDPVETVSTNILGTTHLLDAVRRCPEVRSLVCITSDKCYENSEWVWGYRESDPLGGHDPYSASKAGAEIMFSAYTRSFFTRRAQLGGATTRAGNVIGGGDWASDRIVPDCIRALQAGKPIVLRNPLSTRPWQHVLEPLSGYLLLAAKLYEQPKRYSTAWNFGPMTKDVRTVHDVASAIVAHLGRGTIEVGRDEARPHEAGLLQLNCDKAHQLLRWYPRWGVDRTLSATAEWYAAVLDRGESAEMVTRRQILDYFPELK